MEVEAGRLVARLSLDSGEEESPLEYTATQLFLLLCCLFLVVRIEKWDLPLVCYVFAEYVCR